MQNDKGRTHKQKSTIYAVIAGGIVVVVVGGLLLRFVVGGETQDKTFTVGIVNEVLVLSPVVEGFKAGMTDLGYTEGENIVYIYNGPTPASQAIDDEMESLLAQDVDLILSVGGLPTRRAKQAVEGTDMPVVFGLVSNPVGLGIVESIARPNGNLTGVQVGIETPKSLEMLVKIASHRLGHLG
jgi:putative ABC transport system substrate-binding protein